jgi:hypothetical protein
LKFQAGTQARVDMRARALFLSFAIFFAAAAAPRELVGEATPMPLSNSTIMMVPAVMEGLLVGGLLLFFALVGVCCVMSIGTPDVLHSQALPAGKEY